MLNVVEICAGGGGQAIGLESAGFHHVALVESDRHACETLRRNRPNWHVEERDVSTLSGRGWGEISLFAAGVPCPPFSVAGRQLGELDERNLFDEAIRLVGESLPKSVLIENVPGFGTKKFEAYRNNIFSWLRSIGYKVSWRILRSCDFGVPQLRPRFVMVALSPDLVGDFVWPTAQAAPLTVGESIVDLMGAGGWLGATRWSERANSIAPTIVGGSKKHGGADLGPSRSKQKWTDLGVNASGISDTPPDRNFPIEGLPKLTIPMVSRIQGFPDDWEFCGGKTASYRQIGNAFPPPVACAVGSSIIKSLLAKRSDP